MLDHLRHPRDGIRALGRRSRDLHGRGADRRAEHAGGVLQPPEERADEGFPVEDPRALNWTDRSSSCAGIDDLLGAMTVPAIERDVLVTPGDFHPRPHRNCYWLVPGALLAGEHPRAVAPDCTPRIDALLDAGIRSFIDLTEEGEGPAPYTPTLRERADARALRAMHQRFPIRDCGVPTPALMRTTLDAIYAAMAAGDPVYVHCWAGIGRTGTVVGCLLREQGLSARETFALINRKWRVMEKRAWAPKSTEWPSSSRSSNAGVRETARGSPAVGARVTTWFCQTARYKRSSDSFSREIERSAPHHSEFRTRKNTLVAMPLAYTATQHVGVLTSYKVRVQLRP